MNADRWSRRLPPCHSHTGGPGRRTCESERERAHNPNNHRSSAVQMSHCRSAISYAPSGRAAQIIITITPTTIIISIVAMAANRWLANSRSADAAAALAPSSHRATTISAGCFAGWPLSVGGQPAAGTPCKTRCDACAYPVHLCRRSDETDTAFVCLLFVHSWAALTRCRGVGSVSRRGRP